jgi:hypothetical protein
MEIEGGRLHFAEPVAVASSCWSCHRTVLICILQMRMVIQLLLETVYGENVSTPQRLTCDAQCRTI